MKIILSTYFWVFTLLRKGLTFLELGFTFMKNTKYYWGGVHAFEKRFHIFEKGGFTFIKTL